MFTMDTNRCIEVCPTISHYLPLCPSISHYVPLSLYLTVTHTHTHTHTQTDSNALQIDSIYEFRQPSSLRGRADNNRSSRACCGSDCTEAALIHRWTFLELFMWETLSIPDTLLWDSSLLKMPGPSRVYVWETLH